VRKKTSEMNINHTESHFDDNYCKWSLMVLFVMGAFWFVNLRQSFLFWNINCILPVRLNCYHDHVKNWYNLPIKFWLI